MAFQDDVGNLLVRAHLSEVPKPVIFGAAAILLAAVVLVVAHFAGIFGEPLAVVEGPDALQAEEAMQVDGQGDGTISGAENGEAVCEPTVVVVHVAGAVANPGVYPVPEGSRVKSAVDAAGGFGPDASMEAVNLARVVADGEQIYIPTVEEVQSGSVSPAASASGSGGGSDQPSMVNINTADAAGLDALPGVGPATAQRIVDDRTANGPFSSPEDIMRVSGIGEKKFEQMAHMITV